MARAEIGAASGNGTLRYNGGPPQTSSARQARCARCRGKYPKSGPTQHEPASSKGHAMTYDANNTLARILRGELPCIKVAENDAALAFMDLMPQADGHLLVVPKEPVAEIFELSDAATVACIRMTQKLAIALRAALRPDGVFIGQFNGAA